MNSSVVETNVRGSRVYMERRCIVGGGIVAKEGVWIKDSVILKTDIGEEGGMGQREVQEDVSGALR